MKPTLFLAPVFLALYAQLHGEPAALPSMPPVKGLSPQQSLERMQLPPGYHLQLVLSEPEIKEPVVAAFDGNGAMFVAEMRSYMQDIEGTDELLPTSRVSMHVSTKRDGVFDKHTVFIDKLLLPRMILPLDKGQLLVGETNSSDIFLYSDTDGDGVADKKDLWFAGGPRGGNLEHQPSGLLWCADNWIYTTYNSYRLRWTPKGPIKEPTGNNGGQWGLAQDDNGKPWFTNAGGERGALNFQVPIVYGDLRAKGELEDGFEAVWPLVGMADVQGGNGRFRPEDKTLNHYTSTAGQEIYRGDRLPAELRGNLFFGEPVGRLVRRAKVEVKEAVTTLSNPYQNEKSEFLRSSDPCFRPTNLITAPDGTLYIVDMYRGIIQEGNWVRPGSYLRTIVEQYNFDKVAGHGRIWRLVHDTTRPGPQPQLFDRTPVQLVATLEHPNGWWRDTAQKLIILRQDKSVIAPLEAMARGNKEPLARMHALWTLEGLDGASPALVREKLKDESPQVRAAAIRVSESLFKKGDNSIVSDVEALGTDSDPSVAAQSLLTANLLKWPNAPKLLDAALANTARGVREFASQILHPQVSQPATVELTAEEKKLMTAGAEIFNSLCATCHGRDAKGLPMVGAAPNAMLAPSLAASKTISGPSEGPVFVLLHGLVGDIDGKKYEGQMIAMATNDDQWIASVLSYIRNSFGNHAGFIAPAEIARLRVAMKDRTQPWTTAELRAATPQFLDKKTLKLSASHHTEAVSLAIDANAETRYSTGASQTPGMWLQIELLAPTSLTGLILDTNKSPRDYPRGYKVELSADGLAWGKPVAIGKGTGPRTEIRFEPAPAKFIRITQMGAVDGLFWSIHELQVLAAPK
ncbi:MAG: coagulation factor 5/8 type domain protein [Chthoniobacteraceae bacterium]|nr:coagulation factor 5/8 type domain protein [Chthoniobacteraceae bacterium]